MEDFRTVLCGPDQPLDREPHLFCADNPPNEFQRRMGSYSCTGLSHRIGEPRFVCTHGCHNADQPVPVSVPVNFYNGEDPYAFWPGGTREQKRKHPGDD